MAVMSASFVSLHPAAIDTRRLLFNPFVKWIYKGPINHQIHKFIWSPAPLHYKFSMLACTSLFLFLLLWLCTDESDCRYILVLCVIILGQSESN